MSLSGFDRKRAERFAEFIDTASGPRTHRRSSVDDELSPLTQVARRLRELPTDAAPTADFQSALRSFLVATAERDGLGATAARSTRTPSAADTAAWQAVRPSDSALAGKTQVVRQVSARGTGRTRLAILMGVAAGAIVLSGVSAASTGALPGDALYSVKRSTERAQLALAGSDASRGRLYLEFARSRLAEAGRIGPTQVGNVLADMDSETRQGVSLILTAVVNGDDGSGVVTVHAFVKQQLALIAELPGTLPAEAVHQSKTVLNDIDARAAAVAAAVTNSCPFPTTDEMGPKPGGAC